MFSSVSPLLHNFKNCKVSFCGAILDKKKFDSLELLSPSFGRSLIWVCAKNVMWNISRPVTT